MGSVLTFIVITAVWIISFVEPSGYAKSIHLADKINLIIAGVSGALLIVHPKNRQRIPPFLVAGLLVTFIFIPVMFHDSYEGASYLVAFLCVYMVSNGKITRKLVTRSGLVVAMLGLLVMYIYVKGSVLNGWNDNAISMVGLFSFLYFSISLIYLKGTRKFWIYNIITAVYVGLMFETDCRSGILFMLIGLACILYHNFSRKLFAGNRLRVLLVLNMPLIIAIVVIAVSNAPYFDDLDYWSFRHFEKGIFSDREVLWNMGFENFYDSSYMGDGEFMFNYHNSAVAALSVFGILGYLCWIGYFYVILNNFVAYIGDRIVFGSYMAFILIFLQQSFDLGFINAMPNLIPYMILGVGLGRIRYLKSRDNIKNKESYETLNPMTFV